MDTRVTIRYVRDVPAGPDQPAHLAGETFTVTDAKTAHVLHPDAAVVAYANGSPFVVAQDASLNPPKPDRKPARATE